MTPTTPADHEQLVRRLHEQACRAGAMFYRDPVLRVRVATAVFLMRRGSCCEGSCRHCPYETASRQRLTT